MQFNDNYGSWDNDMIVGSVHFPLYVETLFWLKKTRCNGGFSMDQYPYRKDCQGAQQEIVEELERGYMARIIESERALSEVHTSLEMLVSKLAL